MTNSFLHPQKKLFAFFCFSVGDWTLSREYAMQSTLPLTSFHLIHFLNP